MDEIKTITDDDQRKLVRYFLLFQEVLDLFGLVAVGFPTDSFDFFNLVGLDSSFNEFEVDLGILAEVDDGAKKVEKTFVGFE